MTIRSEFNKIIKKLSEIPIGHPDYYEFPAVQAEIALFSRNLEETVHFLDRACDMDQLGWMSKVFSRISANLKSWEFIDALNRAAMRYIRQTDRDLFIQYCIPEAEKGLPDEVYCQRYPDTTEDDRQENKSMSRTRFKREFTQIIKLYKIDSEEGYTDLPYYWDASPVILAEIAVLSRNLKDTIRFLDHDCTGLQLDCMCAVFGEVSSRLKTWEFVDALNRAADRLSKNYYVDRIRDFIGDAIGVLPEEVFGQRFPDGSEDDNRANDLAKSKRIMAIKCEFNKIIKKISEIPIGVPGYYDLPPFRNAIALFSRSLPETVEFLDCVCDVDQLGWMSKVFYQVSANLKSWEFIDALKRAAMRYMPRTGWNLFIKYCIPEAEKGLPDEIYRQRYPDTTEDGRQENKSMSRTRFKRELTKIIELDKIDSEEGYMDLPFYSETSPVILAEIALLSRNLKDTIRFLDHDCTGEQLGWMCAVFGEVSFRLKSWEFVDALERAADRLSGACSEYNIRDCIEYVIGVLPNGVYRQRFPDEPEEGKKKK